MEEVEWINPWKHKEVAFSYLDYGNEASMGCKYSRASVLINVPKHSERLALLAGPSSDTGSDAAEGSTSTKGTRGRGRGRGRARAGRAAGRTGRGGRAK